jgi:hypothetical protein
MIQNLLYICFGMVWGFFLWRQGFLSKLYNACLYFIFYEINIILNFSVCAEKEWLDDRQAFMTVEKGGTATLETKRNFSLRAQL